MDKQAVLDALEDQLRSYKASIQRYRRLAEEQEALANKVAFLEKVKKAEQRLRQARMNIFAAEDAVCAWFQGDESAFERFADVFPKASVLLCR